MTQEQKEQLTNILYTLQMNVNDKSKWYEHTVEELGIAATFEIDRERHLEEVMRWAAQEIDRQFDLTSPIEKEET